ncbi:hypothetical protein DFJ74DRAFT_659549 [Hyaloraphidium curvatum]|nr:hypothetical protein DFJ74DRAFT_659549 [Hyaloraphidium curvatum]
MPRPTQPTLEPSKSPELAARFNALFAPSGLAFKLVTDKQIFTEGPSYLPAFDVWVYSDIPGNRQMVYYRKSGAVDELVPKSNNTNGTFYSQYLSNKRGKGQVMLCCEHAGRAVVRMDLDMVDGKVVVSDRRVIVNTYGARLLNSPNDCIETDDGFVIFTDPMYGCYPQAVERGQGHGNEPEQDKACVYRFHHDFPAGTLTRIVTDMVQPNGLTIPPNMRDRLYIADTGVAMPWTDKPFDKTRPHHMRVYPIDPSKGWAVDQSKGRLFADIPVGAPDGIRTDAHGNVWSNCGDGIHIHTPAGELLGKIRFPDSAVNSVWGGPGLDELLVCSHERVWHLTGIKVGLKKTGEKL